MRHIRQLPGTLAILMLAWGLAGPATPTANAVHRPR